MNKTNKLRTLFSPETRFELRPTTALPFRANLETEFEQLKKRLLTERLLANEEPTLTAPLRRAANEAAALAWVTFVPLLVFPALFEEKSRVAERQASRQARIYANSRDLLAA